jgi:hypothetical protein
VEKKKGQNVSESASRSISLGRFSQDARSWAVLSGNCPGADNFDAPLLRVVVGATLDHSWSAKVLRERRRWKGWHVISTRCASAVNCASHATGDMRFARLIKTADEISGLTSIYEGKLSMEANAFTLLGERNAYRRTESVTGAGELQLKSV